MSPAIPTVLPTPYYEEPVRSARRESIPRLASGGRPLSIVQPTTPEIKDTPKRCAAPNVVARLVPARGDENVRHDIQTTI
jgi:hypothetical protein